MFERLWARLRHSETFIVLVKDSYNSHIRFTIIKSESHLVFDLCNSSFNGFISWLFLFWYLFNIRVLFSEWLKWPTIEEHFLRSSLMLAVVSIICVTHEAEEWPGYGIRVQFNSATPYFTAATIPAPLLVTNMHFALLSIIFNSNKESYKKWYMFWIFNF